MISVPPPAIAFTPPPPTAATNTTTSSQARTPAGYQGNLAAGARRRGYDRPVLRPAYPIETARLTLRPFTFDDVDDVCAYQSRPEVVRYLYWETRDRAQVQEYLEGKVRLTALEREGDGLALAIVWREVGFILNPDFQGRGLATEAAEVVLRLGFDRLGLHRIVGRCDARNLASACLMERLGMRQEAHFVHNEVFKGEWGDELVYAMLDHEWRSAWAAGT